MKLSGKVAVVTGAASGVGRATSFLLAREGAAVICVDIDRELGDETVEAIRHTSGVATFLHADVGDATSVKVFARQCLEAYPRVDVLFNNAGILVRDTVDNVDLGNWQRMIAVNLTGPYLVSIALLPALRAAGSASIIHHGSIDAVLGNPTSASYSVSKGGLIPLTHVMAHSWAQFGIRVNCINSGGLYESRDGIPVRITPELRDGTYTRHNSRMGATPLARPGLVEECATAVLFLASEDSSYMTGSVLTIDGGRTAITPGTAPT